VHQWVVFIIRKVYNVYTYSEETKLDIYVRVLYTEIGNT